MRVFLNLFLWIKYWVINILIREKFKKKRIKEDTVPKSISGIINKGMIKASANATTKIIPMVIKINTG